MLDIIAREIGELVSEKLGTMAEFEEALESEDVRDQVVELTEDTVLKILGAYDVHV